MEVILGKHSYIGEGFHTEWETTPPIQLRIGKFCSIANGLRILAGGNHHTDWATTYPTDKFHGLFPDIGSSELDGLKLTKGDITIGNDVWIGMNVTIFSGVHIGDGAVIGAFSVVTRDITSYSIACGNPATERKYRFDLSTNLRLKKLAWWDWDDDKLHKALPLMLNTDIEKFLNTYEEGR